MLALGSPDCGDDAAGPAVAARLRALGVPVRELGGAPDGLLDRWRGVDAVVVVDAIRSGAPPGTLHRRDVTRHALPAAWRNPASTHALGIAEAIELARVLDALPARLVVHGVEGSSFSAGAPLSAPVAAALPSLTAAVVRELDRLLRS